MRWLDVTFVLGTVIQAHVKRIFCRGGCLRLKGAGPKALLTEGSYLPRAAGAEGLVFKPCSPVMPLLTEGSYLPRAAVAEGLVFKPCSPVMFLSSIPSLVAFGHRAEGTPLRIVGCS
ncbi:unnamed protein product, partial [Cuscuta europaea]